MAGKITRPVYAVATNIVSSLGLDTKANWQAAMEGRSGIEQHTDRSMGENSFYASRLSPSAWQYIHSSNSNTTIPLSPFEQMAVHSARKALEELEEPLDRSRTVLILSSTKGNIEWLNQKEDHRTLLVTSARLIAQELGISNKPIVVSLACVSGVAATIYGLRLLESGRYDHAIVVGADRFTSFVLSGFQSFKAVDEGPCKPFDMERRGVNLGEAAATVVLSATAGHPMAQLLAGATSNDANHISGPSRTGEELADAINNALDYAAINASQIDLVSAHGTATPYNDEMEAKAFTLSRVANSPIHSFKGYVGHTLGAAGVVENAMLLSAIQHQQLIPSFGYKVHGVSQPLNITTQTSSTPIRYALKTASGFGGCNAAVIWKRLF